MRTVRVVLAAAVLAAVACAVLVAAGGQSAHTTITTPTTPAQQWKRDSDYILALAERDIPGTEGARLAAASAVCRTLTEGGTWDETVADVEQRLGVEAPDAEYVAAAAVRYRCPEHTGVLGVGAQG